MDGEGNEHDGRGNGVLVERDARWGVSNAWSVGSIEVFAGGN